MKIEMADDFETISRRDKINAILDCFYTDEEEGCNASDCLLTDKSCLSDFSCDEEDIAKIKVHFPKFEESMMEMDMWQLADVLYDKSTIQ